MITIEEIDQDLQRGTLAASVEMPIEQQRELLLIARDMLQLVMDAKAYKEKHKLTIHTTPEYLQIIENVLGKY